MAPPGGVSISNFTDRVLCYAPDWLGDIVTFQRRARQKLEQPRQDLGYREGHRDEQPPPAAEAQRDPDQFAQRVDVWPGKLVDLAGIGTNDSAAAPVVRGGSAVEARR